MEIDDKVNLENEVLIEKTISEMDLNELFEKKNQIINEIKELKNKLNFEKGLRDDLKGNISAISNELLKNEESKIKADIEKLFKEDLKNNNSEIVNLKIIASTLYKLFKTLVLIFCISTVILIGVVIWLIDFENILFFKDIIQYLGPDLSIALSILILIAYIILWWVLKLGPLYFKLKKAFADVNDALNKKLNIINSISSKYCDLSNIHKDFRIHTSSINVIKDFRRFLQHLVYKKLNEIISKFRDKSTDIISNNDKKIKDALPTSNTMHSLFNVDMIDPTKSKDYIQILNVVKKDLVENLWSSEDLVEKFVENINIQVDNKKGKAITDRSIVEILIDVNNIVLNKEIVKRLEYNTSPSSLPFSTFDSSDFHFKIESEMETKIILADNLGNTFESLKKDFEEFAKYNPEEVSSQNNLVILRVNPFKINKIKIKSKDKGSDSN